MCASLNNMRTGESEHWLTGIESSIAGRKVLCIVDPAVEKTYSITKRVQQLGTSNDLVTFTQFPPNPTWESLLDVLKVVHNSVPETVIAVGGGTAIDLAKLTAMALELGGAQQLWNASQTQSPDLNRRSNIRLLSIPTTAGTGAEATRFAVLYRDEVKYSIAGEALKPDQTILDPALLESLPSRVIADAGLDAACQAMESLWSVQSTLVSEKEAWRALHLTTNHLKPAVITQDRKHLEAMLTAAHLAGKAINLTTTSAPHALSYGLTTHFGIPHGRAVALLFGPVFARTLEAKADNCQHPKGLSFLSDRLKEIASAWGPEVNPFPHWWRDFLNHSLGIVPPNIELTSPQLKTLVETVNAKRLANNPILFSENQIESIYNEALKSPPS